MEPLQEPLDPAKALVMVRRYLDATYHIAEAALGATEIEDLYERVHASIRGLMPADNLYFALRDGSPDTVSFPYWVDSRDPAPGPRRLGRGLTELVLRTGTPLLLGPEDMETLIESGEVESIGTPPLAWLGAPLSGSQGVFGALVLQLYEGSFRYTAEERDLLQFVSGQVAMVIERRRAETSLRMMAAAVNQARDAVYGMNAAGQLVFVNEAACRQLGYDRNALLSLTLREVDALFPADQWPDFMASLKAEGTRFLESEHRRKDGTTFPVEISVCHLSHEGQDLAFGYARDITGRRIAEAALRQSEDKFSRAFHASPDAINLTRLEDGTYLDVSEGFVRLTGWTRDEVLGRSALDLGIWADPGDRARAVRLIREQGEFTGLEAGFRRKDGSILTGLMSGKIVDIDGEPCLLSVTRDISERQASELALRTAERRLRTVLANSPAIIYQLDPEGRFTLSEGLSLAQLGLRPGEAVGLSALELYKDDPVVVDQIHRAMAGQASREITTNTGGRIFDHLLTPVFEEGGRLESMIGIATDITDRRLAEEALLAERGLFVGGPVMVFKWRAQLGWPVEYASPNVATILGHPAEAFTSGRIVYEGLIHPEDLPRVRQEIRSHLSAGRKQFEQQYRLRTADGAYRWFHDFTAAASQAPSPSHFLGYLVDITDRRQAEEALRQAQKLESLGVLAGGIAHDFNNLLTVVMGNLNLAQMRLPASSPAHPYLVNMEATVLRATELTKQMLAYSGRGHFQVRPLDLNAVVHDLAHLLEVSISKKVRLRIDPEPGLPAILADAAQIQQVVMNLVTNASDAIGDQDGAIHISTTWEDLDEAALRDAYHLESPKPGRFVLLEVEDTGSGMTPEVMERIFDPFFTTKATGRGLGLSAMQGILRGHAAGLQITSEVGRGSRFRLCFPTADLPADALPSSAAAGEETQLQGRVLLVDDEAALLETTASALSALGFEVLTARDGVEALERFRERRGDLDLVLMDLTMPRLDGREAFAAMRALDPGIPVVLSSGFTEQDTLKPLPGGSPSGFLQKPYQLKDLREILHRVLGR